MMPVASISIRSFSLFVICLLLSAVSVAGPTFVSPPGTVTVVELYTSEGCSSCPPADTALRQLPQQVHNNRLIAPLAFHVDYWDYIGWQDPYAKPGYTARQRSYSRLWQSRTVYTPQFVIQGQQTRHGTDLLRRINPIMQQPAPFHIAASFDDHDSAHVNFRVSLQQVKNEQSIAGKVVLAALYENNLSSQVSRGENSGRELQHDFVVRRLSGSYQAGVLVDGTLALSMPLQPSWKARDLGLVIFVQDPGSGRIVQALHVTPAEFPL